MLYTTPLIAALGMAWHASAHMKMSVPTPFSVDDPKFLNGPLDASGSDYPCKGFSQVSTRTSMPLGSNQTLAFIGSAVHGGGSCQISITYDLVPSKSSVFKVIHSIEGGCPARNSPANNQGDASVKDPDEYSFSIPTDLPAGDATIAWTWFNKVGNREMYMNCGPITLASSHSKRSDDDARLAERDQAAFNALPNMFTANIKNIGNDGCATSETFDLTFPNPGSSVDKPGASSNFGPPAGNCVGGAAAAAVPSSAPSSAAAPAASGGVFVTVAASSAAPSVAAATPAASSAAPAAVSPSNTPAAPAASASASPVASSGSTTPGSPCSPEGLWNCVGGTSFQQCGSGTWSVIQQLAAGTTCTPGQSTAINIVGKSSKRSIRFSSEHVRRHVRKSI